MKLLACIGVAVLLVGLSLAAASQQSSDPYSTTPPNKRPHSITKAPSSKSYIALPATAYYRPTNALERVYERALYAETYQHQKDARMLFLSGDLAGAEREAKASLDTAPSFGGHKDKQPLARHLLAKIYLAEGRNQEALTMFQSCYRNIADAGQNLDISIAYARLGNYEQAKHFYSDRAITQYRLSEEPLLSEDLPGTADLKHLEASALLARGIDASLEERMGDALADFQAAQRLVPDSLLLNYSLADALREESRNAEAVPYLERVIASPRGHIFHEAKRRLQGIQFWAARQTAQKAATQTTP